MPHIPSSIDEFERAVEGGVSNVKHTAKGQVVQTGKSLGNQVKVRDKEIGDWLYGVVSGEPSQEEKDDPRKQQEAKQREIEEQKGPPSNQEKYGTLADQIPIIPNQRDADVKPSSGSIENQLPLLPGVPDPGKTVSIGEQLTGQSNSSEDMMKMAGIDPTKQMSAEDNAKLDETQKAQREKMRLHERNYATVTSGIDTIGTLDEQIAKERQRRDQQAKQAQQEEEERKKKKREEKEQQSRQLEAPRGKKQGVGTKRSADENERTKTERRSRGGAG